MLKESGSLQDLRTVAKHPEPKNKLSPEERQEILDISNSPQFADRPPTQIVPALADNGVYIASESSFYRVLREENMCHQRRKGKTPEHRDVPTLVANGPNEVWMWDITYLRGPIKGSFYYLYVISDLFSRYIVGWEVWEEQTAEHASELVKRATLAQHVNHNPLYLHSDNGSPMKGSTMLATLEFLGITPSFSRPRVSNDNAYAESLFNTLKGRPNFKDNGFMSIEDARQWADTFVDWYHTEHHHSGLKYLTPQQRHSGEWKEVIKKREALYSEARTKHPERWNGRDTRDWTAPEAVYLNHVNA